MVKFASTPEIVQDAVHEFNRELERSRELASRLSYVRSWYAIPNKSGGWFFGPSKWVGYEGLNAETYLEESSWNLDGRDSEKTLQKWYQEIDPSFELYGHLKSELRNFLSRYGKAPNKNFRINIRKKVINTGVHHTANLSPFK